MNKAFLYLFLSLFFITPQLMAEDKKIKEIDEKSIAPDFSAIQDVLKNDSLEKPLKEKLAAQKKKMKRDALLKYKKFIFPVENDFWSFMTEYWLVKNAPALKWNFEKPDYALRPYFTQFLENFGYYEVKFKILLLDTPNITHFAFPSNKNEFIVVLSVPFIRTLNLSKLEISLILFEDFIRLKEGYFKDYASIKELDKLYGTNFSKKGFDKKILSKVTQKYDEMVFDKGFNFQQQFKVTTKVSSLLKSQMKLWNTYYKLIGKINDLISTNLLYKNYTKIYPSPELQMGWLSSKE